MPTGRWSTISTDAPRRASSCAMAHPTIPAPTTMMSEGRPMKSQLSWGGSSSQHGERVIGPRVVAECRDAPELAQRLDRARGFRGPHVGAIPSELLEDFGDDRLR